MSDNSAALLKTDELLDILFKDLERLKTIIADHDTAKQSLIEVRAALVLLVEQLRETSSGAHEVVTVMRSVGTAEILDRIGEHRDRVHALENTVARLTSSVKATIDGFAANAQSQSTSLERAVTSGISQMDERALELSSTLVEVRSSLDTKLIPRIERLEKDARSRQATTVSLLVVLLIVGIFILIIGLAIAGN